MDKQIQISGLSVLLLRVALSGIFVVAGVSHLLNPDGVTPTYSKCSLQRLCIYVRQSTCIRDSFRLRTTHFRNFFAIGRVYPLVSHYLVSYTHSHYGNYTNGKWHTTRTAMEKCSPFWGITIIYPQQSEII